ncbi:DUF4129 domain-containing protein [Haloferax mediterranei ATCC 33500]|uniref:DUF4129 domain-containing protein n=1 Tax=Haloferax mediterranei (strain ATCC 33500 / DSM 1411 / JCM 8866 / NBRC 14739 / NCIMB 2177 / R-4) TaxID=523841 RepID=I3R275_HALMT|nr:DUF4129 domain-containing protein [Haloferax mediterranei]AFK18335.1 hypothetical protein HFX_0610 [Haloferax mediterranei ATCC 33500]AHZ22269.1 hypothetical protein BM92_06210 [Haloferax mediterranei ATCC 33500]EMA02395.1 hypothetical protein C439_07430 [Haloferax mediterranei ATCC 33500]MDX5988423.1 DUF4129 domain-containing protein [Haloferax mediterranei ATCC 33500]QCQ74847.1 DUF4129 domain-containing protein [Haloferax mediterranei ATCC 33500]
MDRSALRSLVLALLAVVALSLVAATIDSTVVTDGGPSGFGVGSSDGGVAGESESTGYQPASSTAGDFDIPAPCFPWLLSPTVIGLISVAFLLLGGYVYLRSRSLLPPLAVFLTLGPPVILVISLFTACSTELSFSSRVSGAARNVSFLPPGGGGQLGDGGSAAQTVSPPTLVFGLLLAVALVVALVMLVTGTGDTPTPDDDAETVDVEPDADVAAVGRAAGAAAERIESDETDVENEVFRAWGEMTTLLDVPNPQSATPAEFAASAVDAGMSRGDVTDLTTLFEEVRYGGFEATTERERRAVSALRNIESTYANREPGHNKHGSESGEDTEESQ